ncbi:MAG TPA: ABC transporter ATP-binding protein [Acidimicrobiia bacterium]|nr:ABC transporter ATP-binding protein [Acidimicrobiia bacterium]
MTAPAASPPTRSTAPLVISVKDLQVHFKVKTGVVHAVDGVSFDVRDGETLGLVGETGCGKTVTARSFLRLVKTPPGIYAGGRIDFWSGDARRSGAGPVDLLRVPDREMLAIRGDRIAMIFQDPAKALNPSMSIGDQVAEVLYQHRSDDLVDDQPEHVPRMLRRASRQLTTGPERLALRLPPWRKRASRLRRRGDELVAAALAETQIANPRKIMDRYPHELSGGMKQRVMIAQALACNPDLLIADEPTTALDVTVQARILELIADLQRRHGTSVLYISHDLSLVRQMCDRVAVMYAGRIVETGNTRTVFSDPLHPYTRGLMAAVPSASQKRGELLAIEGNVPELIDPPASCRFHTRCGFAVALCEQADPELLEIRHGHGVACLAYASAGKLGVPNAALPLVDGSTR